MTPPDSAEAAGPKRRAPGLALAPWARDYDGRTFRRDLAAGLTVAVMLVPQSMAYALLAGVPPIYGLYASLVPLVVYPLLGSSMHLAVGVIAIDMLIVKAGLDGLAPAFSDEWIGLAILLGAMVGVIQLVVGFARLGFLVHLLSRPVVVGFTSGAAILIALSQVGSLTGLETGRAQTLPGLVGELSLGPEGLDPLTLSLGMGSLVALIVLRRWKPRLPSVLAVVVVATALVWLFGLEGRLDVVGEVPRGLPTPALPDASLSTVQALLPTATALALVQFLTVISLGKVLAARHRYRVDPDRELLAVGAANLVGSFFRSLPVSGSFSRSALNEQSGAETPAANVVAAGGVAVALLLLTPALALVPLAALAAIIVVAALGLFDLAQMRFLWRAKSADGVVALLAFAATLTGGILTGIGVGVLTSVAAILLRISRPNVAVLGHLAGTRSFRDVRHADDARNVPGILILRVDASFSFMNAEYLHDLILERTAGPDEKIRAVVIDASSINDLDLTAADVLVRVKQTLENRGIELYFGGAKEPVRDTLDRADLYEQMGTDRFFLSPHRAITHILTEWGVSEEYLRNVPGAASPVNLVADAGPAPGAPITSPAESGSDTGGEGADGDGPGDRREERSGRGGGMEESGPPESSP